MQHKLKICGLIFFSVLLLFSCNKKDKKIPKQYSTWIVNGTDTFTTNETDSYIVCNPDKSYCSAVIHSKGTNSFSLAFSLWYFPTQNPIELTTTGNTSNPTSCTINIKYNGTVYYHAHALTQADTINGYVSDRKIKYSMPPYWFVNYDDPNDSALMQGVFSEP